MTDTQTIKDRVDIVQLLTEYIPLKKAGANWKAPCPFHREKTPSFMVHPEKQIWHCFGCGKGGDIFTFIQEIEGLDFPEALKLLADRAGVKIDTFKSEIDKSQKNRLLEINSAAANFYHQILLQMPQSKTAREYLDRRALKAETIENWKIGFIPDQWDLLTKYLLKKGFGIDDLVASGLTIKRDGADAATGRGFYDRFRGRIMFPIWDAHDNVVGFTGRVLVETENSGGKYVNTPQSLAYDKSRVIYGLNKAKMEIKAKDFVVLVEGQMDVIACHQNGMKNVVASSGTALTSEQIRLLKRYTNNISIAFDADAAGQNAAKRGIDIALTDGMNIKVIRIPEGAGKDADECLKKNPDVWFRAVSEAEGIMEWYFRSVLSKADISSPRDKQRAANALLAEIIKIPYAVEQDEWIKKLSEALKIDASILREEAGKIKKNPARAAATVPEAVGVQPVFDRQDLLATRLFSIFVKFPRFFSANPGALLPAYFTSTGVFSIYELFNKYYNNNIRGEDEVRNLLASEASENQVEILQLQADKDFADWGEAELGKEVRNIIREIRNEWSKKKRREIQEEMRKAEASGDRERVDALLQELQSL